MSSVKNRISEIKQPKGGYINPSQFTVQKIPDQNILNEQENIHASLIGMAVDYLTRLYMGAKPADAFKIPCTGAFYAEKMFHQKNAMETARSFLENIQGNDDQSIINACKLVTFDVWFRNPMAAQLAKGADEVNPDAETVNNIKIMLERSMRFWESYGPIIKDGFTFEPNGYTKTVDSGDGDYMTADTMWDFKVLKSKPTSKHTLQLLMYWIMGQHSGQDIYKGIKSIGIFNPRLNTVYLLKTDTISRQTIEEVEKDVICYQEAD